MRFALFINPMAALRRGLPLLAAAVLAGCGIPEAAGKIFEVVKDPEVQVGDDGDQPSTVDVVFFAQHNANVNSLGEEVPVSVLVLEMSGDSVFQSSEIFEFLEDPKKALDDQFISAAEHSVPPGEFLALPPMEMNEETTFVGVVGLFSDVEDVQWRDLAPVETAGKAYVVTVEIAKGRIAMTLEER